MNGIFKMFRSNDTLYWLYAKSLYNTQKYVNDIFEANQILDNLWLGGCPSVCNRESLKERGIETVIIAVYGATAAYPFDFKYSKSNLKDVAEENIISEINKMIPEIHESLSENKGVLVSCVKGRSRSCSIVAAYLIKYHEMSTDEALAFIKNKRSQVSPNLGYIKQLRKFEKDVIEDRNNKKNI